MSRRVHHAADGPLRPVCGAGSRWASTMLTVTRGTRLVTCTTCQKILAR